MEVKAPATRLLAETVTEPAAAAHTENPQAMMENPALRDRNIYSMNRVSDWLAEAAEAEDSSADIIILIQVDCQMAAKVTMPLIVQKQEHLWAEEAEAVATKTLIPVDVAALAACISASTSKGGAA